MTAIAPPKRYLWIIKLIIYQVGGSRAVQAGDFLDFAGVNDYVHRISRATAPILPHMNANERKIISFDNLSRPWT
ncbi:MAG: hypothetical protein JWM58_1006 [Rhizobium sp.]|nr:hypothetical protein [Rhizobium sp.]